MGSTIPSLLKIDGRSRSQRIRRVCESLEKKYGRPRFGNPSKPLDDLIYIILSNRTLPKISQSVFKERKIAFPKWEDAIRARPAKMRRIIQRAGLSMIKTNQVRSALRKIRSDFGECSLDSLKYLSCAEAEDYLISLPGVSEKVAKCVLMYTMNCRVLPVDVHVYRISHRLGWTVRKRADQCHEELESLVRPEWRFAFHVDCIAHGRSCCKSQFPTCDRCCINKYCEYYRGMR